VARLLAMRQVPANCLRVEITEGAIMSEPARAMEVLTALRGLGVGLSVDDFGTGYSSLAYLKRLPVDELKIDRSFVRDMATDDSTLSIVRSAIELAHNLGLRVVAEGVEDAPTLELLQRLSCDKIQGYFLSRPLSATDATVWLRHNGVPAASSSTLAA
jgi:EAL domain-containing protein (putative c-di-GMP-specific phosphodiesterase class I)